MFFENDVYNLASGAVLIGGIQLLFFLFAAAKRTDKITDLSYAFTFFAATAVMLFGEQAYTPLQITAAVCVALWAFRLGEYLFVRVLKLGKDQRFDGIRESFPRFAFFWFFQAISIWVIMLPVMFLLSVQGDFGFPVPAWIGVFLWMLGFIIEVAADLQKYRAKNRGAKWVDTGLWHYSRHPNYFGESLIWWGVFFLTVPVLSGWLWIALLSPVFITSLLLFGTGVPTVEKRHDKEYGGDPDYREYKRRTSIFIPLPPKK
jgi:steroid 5-alpha reductase family enzyme